MEVFSRVLKQGTRFDTRETLKAESREGQLCEVCCAFLLVALVSPTHAIFPAGSLLRGMILLLIHD